MSVLGTLRYFFRNVAQAVQLLAEIRDGVANLTDLTDRRLKALEATVAQAQRVAPGQERPGLPSQSTNPAPPASPPGRSRFFPR